MAKVRIIGGYWRGKHIDVPDNAAVRPTGDRIRETLFNWLDMHIYQAHCLDLFAGSGILGLEALSRGANQVTFIDSDATIITHLEKTIMHLPLAQRPQLFVNSQYRFPPRLLDKKTAPEQFNSCVHLLQQDALLPISPPIGSYDIIFLDPPFTGDLLTHCIPLLKQYGYEKRGSLVYIEMPATQTITLPAHWKLSKQGKAGNVVYQLIEVGV